MNGTTFIADGWHDFTVLDMGEGMKLERWGGFTLSRPDPQVIWPVSSPALWQESDAVYSREDTGGGFWSYHRALPERWILRYNDLSFYVKPTGFKHTGLFPEQAVNWDWMAGIIRDATRDAISNSPSAAPPSVLNLFAYTGGATLACAKAGAFVTHVDAAKGMIQWAKENASLSRVPTDRVRWIVEDVQRFVDREIRRGHSYDAILMDPPSYGRGPGGEVWKLERCLYPLVASCVQLLSRKPLFFLINSYTTGLQPAALYNVLNHAAKPLSGVVDAREVTLPVRSGGILPCGASARWTPSRS